MKAEYLVKALECAESCWNNVTIKREDMLDGVASRAAKIEFIPRRFESLPEIIQLVLAIRLLTDDDLNDLAVKEGNLDLESRASLTKDAIILVVAGSINRGATAESTSSFRVGSRRFI